MLLIVALPVFSCEKNEEVVQQEEAVKIFMSVPEQPDDLKSGNKNEIFNDDTVLIHSRDVNSIMWAENKYGEAVKGAWRAELIETDYSEEFPDYPLNQVFGYSGENYSSQIAYSFPEFGLYQISIGKFDDRYNRTGYNSEITFYVKVVGIPGLVGDSFENNYIFRMEKKHFAKSLVPQNVFIIYYKYNEAYEGYYCWISNKDEYPRLKETQNKMKKWPYSRPGEEYYYLILQGLSGTRTLTFMGAKGSCNGINCGFNDQNEAKSSWFHNNGIVVNIP